MNKILVRIVSRSAPQTESVQEQWLWPYLGEHRQESLGNGNASGNYSKERAKEREKNDAILGWTNDFATGNVHELGSRNGNTIRVVAR